MSDQVKNIYTGFARTKDEFERKFWNAESVSSEYITRALSSIRDNQTALPVDWSDFSQHIYFNSAELKTQAALNKVISSYPIGLSGQNTSSLSSANIAVVDNYLFKLNGYEKYVLNYLGGVTGNSYIKNQPTITAIAISESGSIELINLRRNFKNGLTGEQVTLSANLLALAQSFDAGLNTIQLISGTAVDFNIVYFDDGTYYTGKVLPETRIEYINRQSNMTEWVPAAYSIGDTEDNLKRYMSVIGAIFDDLKIYIDQFSNINHISYDSYNRYPDGDIPILIAKHFGYELIDTLLRQDITKYLTRTETKVPLYQVSYKIWQRVLNNLIWLYKKKGTLEAIKSLIRIYGLPADYLQINDYNFHFEPKTLNRIDYKNVRVLNFPGNSWVNIDLPTNIASSQPLTIEARVSSSGISALGGSIASYAISSMGWSLQCNGQQAFFTVISGSNVYRASTNISSSSILSNAINTNWVNLFGIRRNSNIEIWVSWIDESSGISIFNSLSGITTASSNNLTGGNNLVLGRTFINHPSSSGWTGDIHEVKLSKIALTLEDIIEHTRNFESISWMHSGGTIDSIIGQWKLKENSIISGNNYIVNSWTLSSSLTGSGLGSLSSTNNYKLFEAMRKEISYVAVGEFSDDNVDVYINENTKPRKSNILNIGFKPVNAINNDIINVFGNINLSDVKGNPANFYSSFSGYNYGYYTEGISAAQVFKRYSSSIDKLKGQRLQFNSYIDALENLAPMIEGIMNGIEQLVPVRTGLVNRGITIEPHLLESSRFHTNPPNFITETVYSDILTQPEKQEITEHLIDSNTIPFDISINGIPFSTNEQFSYSKEQFDKLITVNEFRFVGADIVFPIIQEVFDPINTQLAATFNRNFLKTASNISDWTASISGIIQLTRVQTGKNIISKQKCIRIELPFSASGNPITATEHWFQIYVEGELLDDSQIIFDFSIPKKTGLSFIIKRKTKFLDARIGIVNIKLINLLNGNIDIIPLFISVDESGIGGTLELKTTI